MTSASSSDDNDDHRIDGGEVDHANNPPKTTKTTTKSREWSSNQLINLHVVSLMLKTLVTCFDLFPTSIGEREKLNYSININNLDPNLGL